jgi:hypothetical protein
VKRATVPGESRSRAPGQAGKPGKPGFTAYARALLHLSSREPLVAFLLLGAALFALHAAVSERHEAAPSLGAPPDRHIAVTAADVDTLRANFRLAWRREPTVEETGDLLETFVNEEILFREGRSLGLDRDDGVVRRRIIEKMALLARPSVPTGDPSRDELRRWYQLYPHRFRQGPRLTFQQRFFDARKHPDAAGDARAALGALDEQQRTQAAGLVAGDEFVLPRVMEDKNDLQVAHLFGQDFLRALQAAPLQRWSGPVTSTFGQHLVFVSKRQDARMPAFEEVEMHVRADWLTVSTRGVKAAASTLLPSYRVTLEGPEAAALKAAAAVAPLVQRR